MIIDENKVLKSIDPDIDIDKNGHCVIPFGVKEIGSDVFKYQFKLRSIIIPDSVTHIHHRAFSHCPILKDVKLSNSLEYIGWYAFYACSNLAKIHLPDALTKIDSIAFSESGLKEIKLPRSACIATSSFACCHDLKLIEIPDDVPDIERSAFYGCSNVKFIKAKYPDVVKELDFLDNLSEDVKIVSSGDKIDWEKMNVKK